MGKKTWKAFERQQAEKMIKYNGECSKWGGITTDSGRVGSRVDLQVDTVSEGYFGECKSSTAGNVPKTPFKWFNKILRRAKELNESEDDDKDAYLAIKTDGRKFKHNIMHCITPERHYELLEKERELEEGNNDGN